MTTIEPLSEQEIIELASSVQYKPGWKLKVGDMRRLYWEFSVRLINEDRVTRQVIWFDVDYFRGATGVIEPAFEAVRAYEESRCRDFFKWRGRRIYNSNVSVDARYSICEGNDADFDVERALSGPTLAVEHYEATPPT